MHITYELYKNLLKIHPTLKDPDSSIVWGFIRAYEKWQTARMPLDRVETELLKCILEKDIDKAE